jgi:hypothetical protein
LTRKVHYVVLGKGDGDDLLPQRLLGRKQIRKKNKEEQKKHDEM